MFYHMTATHWQINYGFNGVPMCTCLQVHYYDLSP